MEVVSSQRYQDNWEGAASPEAARPEKGEGRLRPAHADLLRNDYQKDRDKILHSKAFRRLSHKTQVFLTVEGDHFRTRLTHTLEVSQIARTITRGLGLNEDLTEAIALGHDLGHTPFGHCGEEALSRCMAKSRGIDPQSPEGKAMYRHNVQSLRVVEVIENDGQGLNLTAEVKDGIVHHTGSVKAKTMEGRIVATADRIAYVNHDIDDALRAGMLAQEDLPETTRRVLGETHAQRIETLVTDMVQTSAAAGDIQLSPEVYDAMMELRSFLFVKVYRSDRVMAEVDKATRLIETLYEYYVTHPDEIPEATRALSECDPVRAAVDYIAGMTDRYAISVFEDIFIPRALA